MAVPAIGHCMQYHTVTDALRLINSMGGRAIQISLGDAGSRQVNVILSDDADMVKRICSRGFYVVVHGKYLYNFCRPAAGIAWQHRLLAQELEQAAKMDVDVIIHQGKNLKELDQTKNQAHQTFVDNLCVVLDMTKHLDNNIILENSARQGTECGYTLTDLIDIYQRIPETYQQRIKFCIDTCHIFVAGELDMRDSVAVCKWFDRFNAHIGPSKLACIHFNDSNTEFNGANDNHGSIGRGYIGKVSTGGFQYVCQYATENQIPMILETSSEHICSEINMLTLWSKSKPKPPSEPKPKLKVRVKVKP